MTGSFRGFLQLPQRDRRDVFGAAASRLDTLPSHVEKDFWVCLVLDLVFGGLPDGHPGFFLKGGTSLSKAFGLIDRLSEDIDLVVDRRDLDFTGDRDPFPPEGMTKKKRESLRKELRSRCSSYMGGELRTALAHLIAGVAEGCTVSMDPDDPDSQTLLIAYPTLYPTGQSYVSPTVKIEGGARSATEPSVLRTVAPYIALELGDMAPELGEIRVISAERTYWEKLLILHGRYCGFRDEERLPKEKNRISRHYYDAAMLTVSDVGRSALARLDILELVRNHNLAAFRQAWKRFEEAVPGSLKLVPNGELQTVIGRDYRAMESMLFGDAPEFEWIVDQLRSVEERINGT